MGMQTPTEEVFIRLKRSPSQGVKNTWRSQEKTGVTRPVFEILLSLFNFGSGRWDNTRTYRPLRHKGEGRRGGGGDMLNNDPRGVVAGVILSYKRNTIKLGCGEHVSRKHGGGKARRLHSENKRGHPEKLRIFLPNGQEPRKKGQMKKRSKDPDQNLHGLKGNPPKVKRFLPRKGRNYRISTW